MRRLLFTRGGQTALWCGACLALWAGWFLIYAVPRAGEIRSRRLELKETETTLSELARTAPNLPDELWRLREKEAALEEMLSRLPREEEIPEVTRSFAERAASYGLEVVGADLEIGTIFGPSTAGAERRISVLPYRLVVRGRYRSIGRFLEEVADRGEYVACESVTMTRISGARDSVEAEISVSLYSLAGEVGERAERSQFEEALACATAGDGFAPRRP